MQTLSFVRFPRRAFVGTLLGLVILMFVGGCLGALKEGAEAAALVIAPFVIALGYGLAYVVGARVEIRFDTTDVVLEKLPRGRTLRVPRAAVGDVHRDAITICLRTSSDPISIMPWPERRPEPHDIEQARLLARQLGVLFVDGVGEHRPLPAARVIDR